VHPGAVVPLLPLEHIAGFVAALLDIDLRDVDDIASGPALHETGSGAVTATLTNDHQFQASKLGYAASRSDEFRERLVFGD